MILLRNITKYIHGEALFKDLSLTLHSQDKIGLVGRNGVGKSTILKIISGLEEVDKGSVDLGREKVGYLPQEINYRSDETIGQFLAYSPKSNAALGEVGLDEIDFELPVKRLSGGQKTRLALAQVLLERPSVLLLDEPTNHLDAEGIVWLETFITQFHGSVVIVSHDRSLLNNTVSKILELDPVEQNLKEYPGNYDDYLHERQKRIETQQQKFEQQQKEKKRLESWLVLKRQEASVHPDPSKGRLIRNMEKRIQREIYDNPLSKPQDSKKMNQFSLHGAVGSGKLILRVEELSLTFGSNIILNKTGFELRGTQRAMLSGPNGSGKTTLLKIIAGEIKPDAGSVIIGERVRFGYFSQEHENLDPTKTVLEEFHNTERLRYQKDPRLILGSFLFTGNDINKKIGQLSLGERVRLIFCKLVHQENQLLLLDEPTNHLDIPSKEVIEHALLDYQGSILVVSHDRYFINKIHIDTELQLIDGRIKQLIV